MLRKQAVFEYAATRQRLRCFGNVRFGSKADICGAKSHVCFTPNRDRKSGLRQTIMSALPLKADMCGAMAHVCFGPIADIDAIRSPRQRDQALRAASRSQALWPL